jgi:DNA helicase-2/ATP-dependent DNA helicase PcrA
VALRERLNAHSRPKMDEVDLYSEQYEVRDAAKKNVFNGKTYNSVDNIAQFFAERGMPPPSGLVKRPEPQKTVAATPAPTPAPVAPKPPAAVQRTFAGAKKTVGFKSGAVIQHPKYGRGTVLRREGDGEDAKLTVSFPGYGLKKLVEKFAGIRVDE